MILTIINTKGGVGKTTTAINLAAGFAERNRPTLLVDLDSQGHATRCFLKGDLPEHDVGDLIMDRPSQALRSVIPTPYPNLHIVPATTKLIETAELLSDRSRGEERLRRALETMEEVYREIILDSPPGLSILTYNAIRAADLLLVPIQPGVGAVTGLHSLLDASRKLRGEEDVPYRILITMLDLRATRTNLILEELLDEHKRRLLRTIIYRSESINQANLAGQPVLEFLPYSRGAYDYDALCEEILRLRIQHRS